MVQGWYCGHGPGQLHRWRQRRHERFEMSQLSNNRHFRWSLLAAPVAGVLILAGCSGGGGGTDDGGSTEEPAAGAGFSLMVAQANDADDYYAQLAEQYTEETGIGHRGHPLPLRRLQHPGDDAAAGRQRGRHDDPVARNRPADLGHHTRRGGLPRAARRCVRGCDLLPEPKPSSRSTARRSPSRSLWHPWDMVCNQSPPPTRWALTSSRRPTRTSSPHARPLATAASPSPSSPAHPFEHRPLRAAHLGDPRLRRDAGLERAARRRRHDLRRQRMASRCSKTSSR